MKFGSTHWVFLNSRRVVRELLDKRASIYSSRQSFPMASQIMSRGYRTLLMPYGDLWRSERKIMHQILTGTQAKVFEPYQDVESRTLLYEYLTRPQQWSTANGRYANSVIMSVVFGIRTLLDDTSLTELFGVSDEFVKYLAPGSSIVDTLPFLGQIPFLKSLQPWRWVGDDLYRRYVK